MLPDQKSTRRQELEQQAIETQNALRFQALTGINTQDATMSDNDVKLLGAVTQVAFGSFGVQGEAEAKAIPDAPTSDISEPFAITGIASSDISEPFAITGIDSLGFEGENDVSYEDLSIASSAPQITDRYTPEYDAIQAANVDSYVMENGVFGVPSAAESLTGLQPGLEQLSGNEHHDAPEAPSERILPGNVDVNADAGGKNERIPPGNVDGNASGKKESHPHEGDNSGAQRKQDRLEGLQRLEEIKQQHLRQAQFHQSGYSGGQGAFNQNRQAQGVGGGAEPQATDQFSSATEAFASEVQSTLQKSAEILQRHAKEINMIHQILLEAGT